MSDTEDNKPEASDANTAPEAPKKTVYDRYADFISGQSATKSIFQNTSGPITPDDVARVTGKK